jgi:DNA-binding CsgD family transcriptional regulator
LAQAIIDSGLAVSPRDPRLIASRAINHYETGNFDQGAAFLERLKRSIGQAVAGAVEEFGTVALAFALAARITGQSDRFEVVEAAIESALLSPAATPYCSAVIRASLALVSVQRGDVTAAESHYPSLQPLQGRMLLYVSADRVLGLLSTATGQFDQAMAHFDDALAFCRKSGCWPELAWSGCDYGEALLSRGGPRDRVKAITLLEQAYSAAADLGMQPLAKRIGGLQQQAEAKREPAYPAGLSQREVEVLRLIAEGKTDREIAEELIISIRTVATHVGNILNKTVAANRTEAAIYANRQGLVS